MARDTKYDIVDVTGIPDDEPIFVLRAQDAFSVATLRYYKDLRDSAGDEEGAADIERSINRFKAWPTKKLPD